VPYAAINVTGIAESPSSIGVTWDMERNVSTGPNTTYNVTVSEDDSTFEKTETVEGFDNRHVTVDGLNAYRNYTVTVLTFVYNESNHIYATPGKVAHTVLTMPKGIASYLH
jgi:hypothetical protein